MLTSLMLDRTSKRPRFAPRLTSQLALSAGAFMLAAAPLPSQATSAMAAATSEKDTIVITFVGDVGYSGNHTPVSPKGISKRGPQRWRDTTDRIADEINGDLNFMNVETVVTERNDLPRDTKGQNGIRNEMTRHAWRRMTARGLSYSAVDAALEYGRVAHVRGATIYAIGRKEVARYASEGVDLARFDGVQVVCTPGGTVLTVYRNRDFRGLRPRRRRYRQAA